MTTLKPHMRGRTFRRKFRLSSPWTGGTFDEIKFTLRREAPSLDVPDDSNAVAQVTMTGGAIVFDPEDNAAGTVIIAAAKQRGWPTGVLRWELTGRIDSNPDYQAYPIDSGEIRIIGDLTRAP
jgi:hypothetical protein